MSNQVHNYANLSTYVIDGGSNRFNDSNRIVGSTNSPKPIGSLLLDILHMFGIEYTEFGGTDHILGVGKKGNFV